MLFFASAAVSTQPDYIALAMVLALALVVLVMALRKRAALKAPKAETAAMLMAIVADKLGKPLNELRFISIKEVAPLFPMPPR